MKLDGREGTPALQSAGLGEGFVETGVGKEVDYWWTCGDRPGPPEGHPSV